MHVVLPQCTSRYTSNFDEISSCKRHCSAQVPMPSTSRPAASNSCRRSSPEDAAAAPGDIATLVPSPGPQHALPDDAPAARSPLSPPAAPATTRHAPPLQPQHQHQADGRPDQQQQDLGRQLQLAALLLERSRFRDALATLQPLLAKHPGDAAALCLQGRCLAAIGNRPQASQPCCQTRTSPGAWLQTFASGTGRTAGSVPEEVYRCRSEVRCQNPAGP